MRCLSTGAPKKETTGSRNTEYKQMKQYPGKDIFSNSHLIFALAR